ncbi:MAG TPA: hypothetical protein VK997_14060 [Deferrisomatales bacterium]|nr:hypothetical protein [Deferrisomatales bacterium]
MREPIRTLWSLACTCIAALAITAAVAGTIEPGQERVVRGRLSVVNAPARVVVVEVPMGDDELTVGVTLDTEVRPLRAGKELLLTELGVGQPVELRYQRRGDRLIGVQLRVLR